MSNETPHPRDRSEDTQPVARSGHDTSHAPQPAVAPSPLASASEGGSDRGGPGRDGFGGPPGAGQFPGRPGRTGQTGQTGQPPTGVPGQTPPGTTRGGASAS